MNRRQDAGSASIWLLAAAMLVVAVGVVGAIRGAAVAARHRAEGAADLAALAAAGRIGVSIDVCAAAAHIASANGATLRSCVPRLAPDGRSGAVTVRVSLTVALPLVGARAVTASARAGRLVAADD